MNKRIITVVTMFDLCIALSVVAATFELFSRLLSVFLSIKFADSIIENVDISFLYLVITTNRETYKIYNSPGVIALIGLTVDIVYIIYQLIKSGVFKKRYDSEASDDLQDSN